MSAAERFQRTRLGKWLKRADGNSKSFPLFGLLIALALLVGFGNATYVNAGVDALWEYILTALLGVVVGFIPLPLLPRGSHWQNLAIWIVWPGLLVAIISFRGFVAAWIFGCGIGLLLGSYLSYRLWRRKQASSGLSGPVLLREEGKGFSRRAVTSKLTLTSFREALAQLDGKQNASLCLLKSGRRFDVLGDAEEALIVYCSIEPTDDAAWRRLARPNTTDPETEIKVPLGSIEGHYLRRSTVDLALAKQAGEHFIRTGELDPTLTWEEGEDVFNRLPPTRLRTP